MSFTQEKNKLLSSAVKKRLSPKRYTHTAAVADAAKRLSSYCLPDSENEIEAAALLHDIAKEYSTEELVSLLEGSGKSISPEDLLSPAVLHSFAAPIVIRRDFPDFATENILSSAYNHTIGAPDMSVFDEIIFLADYIEDTRTYEHCKRVREYVYSMLGSDRGENIKALHKACVMAIDYTLIHLIENKKPINSKNILTRNALLSKI